MNQPQWKGVVCVKCGLVLKMVDGKWLHDDPDYDPFVNVHAPEPSVRHGPLVEEPGT